MTRPLALGLAALLCVASCSEKPKSTSKSDDTETDDRPKKRKVASSGSARASATAAPAATISATLDGSAIQLQQAFIKRREGGVLQLYATTETSSCKELLENFFNEPPSEKRILLDLKVGPGGTSISDIYTGARNGTLAPNATATVDGTADVGTKNTLTLDYVVLENDKEMLRVKGTIVAEGCGERPP